MDLAQDVRFDSGKAHTQSHDLAIMVGYSILAIMLLAAIFFAAGEPGTAPADFLNMSVFP